MEKEKSGPFPGLYSVNHSPLLVKLAPDSHHHPNKTQKCQQGLQSTGRQTWQSTLVGETSIAPVFRYSYCWPPFAIYPARLVVAVQMTKFAAEC